MSETFTLWRDGRLLRVQVICEIPAKTCANCGNVFYLHEGRSMHDQRRATGVRYCSKRCTSTAANRAYRKRKRATA